MELKEGTLNYAQVADGAIRHAGLDRKIDAIKIFRNLTGCGLLDSKHHIDAALSRAREREQARERLQPIFGPVNAIIDMYYSGFTIAELNHEIEQLEKGWESLFADS